MTDNAKVRLLFLIPALIVGLFLIQIGREFWRHHWLGTDATQARALITNKHSRGVIDYQYTVDEREYSGTIRTHWEPDKFARARIGEESVVYYSASHPSLSALESPDFPKPGWLALTVALGLELFFLIAILKPKAKPPAPIEASRTGNLSL